MLHELIIDNLVLIDHAQVPFKEGFNLLSGETGSGKSALLHALHLVSGGRADPLVIRNGEKKGVVQGLFSIDSNPFVCHLLQEGGIDHTPGEHLMIRREIAATGPSRAFINQQPVQISFLKTIAETLVEYSSQSASSRLLIASYHRKACDLFGNLEKDAQEVASLFDDLSSEKKELEALKRQESIKEQRIGEIQSTLELLKEAALKEGEEEELYLHYSSLVNSKELLELGSLLDTLFSEQILPGLVQSEKTLLQMEKLDGKFKESLSELEQVKVQIKEISSFIALRLGQSEGGLEKIEELSSRLAEINKFKRKFNLTVPEIIKLQDSLHEELKTLSSFDERLQILESNINQLEISLEKKASLLSKKRKIAAEELSALLQREVRALNMPHAELEFKITPEPLNRHGCEHIELHIAPNLGEKMLPINECASGGELARVLLALQTILAGKEAVSTLVFDEIDANIGGQTATLIAGMLAELGKKHQIIAVSHFPQVASSANHHLRIRKIENEGRTYSRIEVLTGENKKKELDRMAGKRI